MTADEKKSVVRLKKDPRFDRPKKKQTKLSVDSRFKAMFNSEEFQVPVKTDKYGRKIVDKSAGKDLERFYRLEEKDQDTDSEAADSGAEPEAGAASASGSESSSSSDDSEDEEEPEMLVLEGTLAHHPLVNQTVELGQATRRLAVVNLDWDQIKAIDILHMVQAFKPITGVIESVKIYPSDFGKERLAKEAVEGPPRDIFKQDEEEEDRSVGDEKPAKPDIVDEGEDFNENELRKYQLERLRYYYAVIVCDSLQTAASIYKQCDGAEFEMSANFLDLRYIPDSVSFDGDEPTDVAEHAGKHYRPKTDVITPALQHSKVKLTWDMDDPDRARMTKVNFSNFDMKENDLRAYLASSSEDEGEPEIDAEKYRRLLLSGTGNVFGRQSHEDNEDLQITFASGFGDIRSDTGSGEGEDDDVHMEATFDGPDDAAKEGASNPDETVFEARLRRLRENKKVKKQARLAKIEEVKAAEKAAHLEDKKKLKKKKRRVGEEDAPGQDSAELDLLMLDDAPKKADEFELDVGDSRFKAVFDEPSFAIDPTHASFKPTKAMRSLIQERQRRNTSRHH